MKTKYRLTWSREPNETGLAAVCQSPRGRNLKVNGETVGRVRPVRLSFNNYKGWYWYACSYNKQIRSQNSLNSKKRYSTTEAACAACEAYVREQLGLSQKKAKS